MLDRQREQILEVDRALGRLALLVVAIDAVHQIGRDRRLAVARRGAVGLGRDAPVLRPLDLGREVARRPELVRSRQAQFASCRSASAFDGRIRPTSPGAKWRSCRSAAEWNVLARTRCTPRAASRAFKSPAAFSVNVTAMICSAGKRGRRDLLRDAPGDRRRLAGAGPGEDAHRPAHRLGGTPLLGVQAVERIHLATVPAAAAGECAKA